MQPMQRDIRVSTGRKGMLQGWADHHRSEAIRRSSPSVRWAFGDGYPAQTLTDAITNKTIFQNWFNSHILIPTPSSPTCSDKLLIYVGSSAQANPRNVYLQPPGVPFGFSSGRISPFSEAPDFVFPIGQAAYNSTITLKTEYLPVTVDIMAAKGCDGMLFSLAEALVGAGILNISTTGSSNVYGGEILYKRKRAIEMGKVQ
ncbi:hypothetical protein MRB53_041862 [Persea americana]|nr:hypothetical protein MRB53_041862 [Persea americana]